MPYIGSLLFILALLALVGFGGSSNTPTPTAQQLIKSAQSAIQKVTSYHFNLKVDNPPTSGSLPLQSADGDIVVPDKLKAIANAHVGGAVLQVQIVAIGNNQYIYLLGGWQKTTGLLDPRSLSDSRTGVSAILGNIQTPGSPTDSTTAGTACWSISGKLNATYLKGITGGGAPAGTMDDITTCIGKSDNLPYLIIVKGIAAQGDSAQTTRTFKLSKFGEHVTIVSPIPAGA
jgi:hypothetical protein